MKNYICYETNEIKTKKEWLSWFSENGNHDGDGWQTSDEWFDQMTKIGLIEKVEVVRTIENQIPFTLGTKPKEYYTETIIILKHGENDFSIFYNMADYSIRGTWEEIAEDYEITMKEKLEK